MKELTRQMRTKDILKSTGKELGKMVGEVLGEGKQHVITERTFGHGPALKKCLKCGVSYPVGMCKGNSINTTDWNEAMKWIAWAETKGLSEPIMDVLLETWNEKAAGTGILFSAWLIFEATAEDYFKAILIAVIKVKGE